MSAARSLVVTGASSGIGAACARAFAARGWGLVLVARRTDRLREVVATLDAACPHVDHAELDVRDAEAVARWARERADLLARACGLVNNAGLARGFEPLPEGDLADWAEMVDTNVKGLLHVTRAVLPHLIARGSGDVVNIGSIAGRWTYPRGAVYCASKAAVRVLTEGMRLDVNGTGIRVSTVDPGLVAGSEFSLVRFHGDADRARSVYAGTVPLQPEDVAETVAWILERPPHVSVAEVVLLPTDQASPTLVHRRSAPSV